MSDGIGWLSSNKMNSKDYLKTLDDYDEKLQFSGCVFQQDSVLIYNAHIIEEFFRVMQ